MSISNYLEAAFLNTLRGGGNGTSYTAPASLYLKLHLADPGEDGTANAAANTTRTAITFAAAASPAGTMTSNADVTWTSVPNSETYSHVSVWDNSTAGNCVWTGPLVTPRAVGIGDTFSLPSGQVALTLD